MYNHFAGIYDELTENVSYSERAEYISGFFINIRLNAAQKYLIWHAAPAVSPQNFQGSAMMLPVRI